MYCLLSLPILFMQLGDDKFRLVLLVEVFYGNVLNHVVFKFGLGHARVQLGLPLVQVRVVLSVLLSAIRIRPEEAYLLSRCLLPI